MNELSQSVRVFRTTRKYLVENSVIVIENRVTSKILGTPYVIWKLIIK